MCCGQRQKGKAGDGHGHGYFLCRPASIDQIDGAKTDADVAPAKVRKPRRRREAAWVCRWGPPCNISTIG
jgi:hypothetical protein